MHHSRKASRVDSNPNFENTLQKKLVSKKNEFLTEKNKEKQAL